MTSREMNAREPENFLAGLIRRAEIVNRVDRFGPARRLAPLLPIALLLALWQVATSAGWYADQLLVPPAQVWAALLELLDSGELQEHLRMSLHRLGLGLAIGASLGLLFGAAMALSKTVEIYCAPLFNVIRQVPSIALIPIFILLFGIGETFKVLIVIKAAFFPVALATFAGVRDIPRSYFEVAHVYQLSHLTLFRRIVLPATVPPIITGFRLALGRSWGTLVAAELLASESGIGQMMEFNRQMFRIDVVMVGVVITGLIGFTCDRGVKLLENWLARWRAQ
jgi:sulfonate transport system permease protein